jgi:hypothetical protein
MEHTISHAESLFSGDASYAGARAKRGIPLSKLLMVSLGAPIVADVNGVCESQVNGAAKTLTLDGASVTAGVAILDFPRNLTVDADNTGTAVLTCTGTDKYGAVMVENITMNGTTVVPGKKAFKTVTSITTSAASTGDIIVGFGDILGLPYRVDAAGLVMAYLDSALDLTTSAVLGTFAAAVSTDPATATTGDVRGTYLPNTATNGTRIFKVLIQVGSTATKVGAYGVDQFGG